MTTKEVFEEMQQRLSQKDSAQLAGSQGVYQFMLTGEDAAEYFVRVGSDGVRVEAGTAEDAAVTVTMTADDFKDLAGGKLNPMSAFMGGKLSVTGDMSMALKLQTLIG
ncbi:MAG: SCP2 sterol-binding domain-containing protein [Firmicutes bacterium]|jgi:putative sterol carrier protein|uniref:Sterol-binding protein n=1 Tax=Sulfobacillus benefaciens TaxID=453960 RepID=A0A2T2WV60_9FIRM|nr:SCP2 sterol-binding domain-containing protein [Bacillota bacterium]MCL5014870.1 SCP2 sterol-binding domain-containing protein [Bacillota bacterium]PSR26137.1 MAG: sterol-binding protein [Sulfobacillus benefaciens]